MPDPNPPPRPYIGSPPSVRHLLSSSERLPVPYSAPPIQERSLSSSTIPAPTSAYSNHTNHHHHHHPQHDHHQHPSSPSSHHTTTYPPIYTDRQQPVANNTLISAAAMAPSTVAARSATLAFDLPPTSTPTGRISKAKKGKRVHGCEFPGCGKVFTRAEHKRRHELNHNPDATYHCGQDGCNKSFHRLDLLQRHQERHELEASGVPTQNQHRRYPSQTSALSEPPQSMPVTSMASPSMNDAPRTVSGGMSIGALVHPSTHSFAPELAGGFGIQGVPYLPYKISDESLYYGAEASPLAAGRFNTSHRQSVSSASSVTGFDGSPMITAATMPRPNWLPGTAQPSTLSSDMYGDEYISSNAAPPMPIPLSDVDGDEWLNIRRELSAVPGVLSSPGGTGVPDAIRWNCLDLYWQYFHPTFPIVHPPTFLPAKPSPLLAGAMVAIGSYYDTAEDSRVYSQALLGITTKILRGRPSITSRSRIADLQTVVLLEVLSTFFARQISVQMSTRFRALFANLNQAQHWLTVSPLAVFRTLREGYTPADLVKAHKFFVEHESRSRILHACTVLDNQQAQLFEQPHTIRRHAGLRVTVSSNNQVYHLPCDDDLWDASPVEKWATLAATHEYAKISQGKPTTPKSSSDLSFLQSQVISANMDQAVPKTPGSTKIKSFPPSTNVFSNRVFNYHLSEMCKHTPIKSLLIVTGESWFLGHKVDKHSDFTQAKQDLRKWIDSATATRRLNTDSLIAHWHALKLLRGLMTVSRNGSQMVGFFGSTFMMHESWSMYLACLVCWAHSLRKNVLDVNGTSNVGVHGNEYSSMTPNGSFPTDVTQSRLEAQSYLMFSETTTPTGLRDIGANVLTRTQGLLETVRSEKVQLYNISGLMDDANRVLSRLAHGKAPISF